MELPLIFWFGSASCPWPWVRLLHGSQCVWYMIRDAADRRWAMSGRSMATFSQDYLALRYPRPPSMATDGIHGDADVTGICGDGQSLENPGGSWSKNQMFLWSWRGRSTRAAPTLSFGILANPEKMSHSPSFPP